MKPAVLCPALKTWGKNCKKWGVYGSAFGIGFPSIRTMTQKRWNYSLLSLIYASFLTGNSIFFSFYLFTMRFENCLIFFGIVFPFVGILWLDWGRGLSLVLNVLLLLLMIMFPSELLLWDSSRREQKNTGSIGLPF